MLTMGIIRELSARLAVLTPSLSYFFCQGTDTKKLNSVTAALRSLMWMLLVQQPHLVSHLQNAYKPSGADLFKGENEFFALRRIFKNMLGDPNLSSVYFIVDALDEFDRAIPGLGDLLDLISTSLTLSNKIKWLVSGRPEVDVLAKVKGLNPDTDALDASKTLVELDVEHLASSISAYVRHKLSDFRDKRGYNDKILTEVSDEVCQRAKDNFLWVFLVLDNLRTKNGKDATDIIKKYPSGLSELYDHKMSELLTGESENLNTCKDVLSATCLAYRPLTFSELEALFPCPDRTDISTIVGKCSSFLTVTGEETVALIHQSAKDYLMEKWLQLDGVARGHARIGTRSIVVMSSMLEQNMYKLPFGFRPDDMEPPDPDPLAPIRYSCAFWADHLCFQDGKSPECKDVLADDGAAFVFLRERFLRWIESLSLLGKLSDGGLSLRKLLHVVQVCMCSILPDSTANHI